MVGFVLYCVVLLVWVCCVCSSRLDWIAAVGIARGWVVRGCHVLLVVLVCDVVICWIVACLLRTLVVCVCGVAWLL